MDLLRLAGAPGVGKSTTAWAIAHRLASDGVATGYVDIDQLGMCYPAPDSDPDRWVLKERALTGVAEEFRRAGVSRLVVSGVAWPDDLPPQIDGISVRSIWLDASELVRRERLSTRSISQERLAQALSAGSAEAERVNAAWDRIPTDNRSESETVEDVLEKWQPDDVQERSARDLSAAARASSRVLWITGPRLAGASDIGWAVVNREWGVGRRTGFVDLAQLSFAWNVDRPTGLANLARLHDAFSDVGTDRFVMVAPLEVDPAAVRVALPNSVVSFVRLTPRPADLRANAAARRRAAGPVLAGDDVLGASDKVIDRVIEFASAQASLPLRAHELNVDTHGLTLEDAVAAVRRAAAW